MTWKEYSIIILCILFSFILGKVSNKAIDLEVEDRIASHEIILSRFDRFLTDIGNLGIMEEEVVYPPPCPSGVDCIQPSYGWRYKFNFTRINELLNNPRE